jgi:hypothetical protein
VAGGPDPRPLAQGRRAAAILAGVIVVAALLGFALSRSNQPPPSTSTPRTTPFGATPLPRQPVSAFGYTLVDDPATRRVVLDGGVSSYDGTWLWDGRRWTYASPSPRPPGRFHAAAAWDPTSGRLMLFGGRLADGQVVSDTWSGDGTSWRELAAGGAAGPPATEGAAMAWDDATRQLLLVTPTAAVLATPGGETWVWAGRWMKQPGGGPPAGTFGSQMAYDPASRSLLLVSASGQTLRWDGRAWRRLPTPALGVSLTGLALDPRSERLMAVASPDQQRGQGTTWEWSGAGWEALAGTPVPAADEAQLVTDVTRHELLLVGSLGPASQAAPQPLHVWRWSAGAWLRLA